MEMWTNKNQHRGTYQSSMPRPQVDQTQMHQQKERIFATQPRSRQNAQIPNQDLSSEVIEAENEIHVPPMRKESRFDVDHPGNQEVAGNANQNPPTPQTPSTSSIKMPTFKGKFRRNLEAIQRMKTSDPIKPWLSYAALLTADLYDKQGGQL